MTGKDDNQKLRLSLVPRGIVEAIAKIREYGTNKYGDPDNWKTVDPQRFWDAALRHMEAARSDYREVDPESGYPHIWHVACNLAFIIYHMTLTYGKRRTEAENKADKLVKMNFMEYKEKGIPIAVGSVKSCKTCKFESGTSVYHMTRCLYECTGHSAWEPKETI